MGGLVGVVWGKSEQGCGGSPRAQGSQAAEKQTLAPGAFSWYDHCTDGGGPSRAQGRDVPGLMGTSPSLPTPAQLELLFANYQEAESQDRYAQKVTNPEWVCVAVCAHRGFGSQFPARPVLEIPLLQKKFF